MLTFLSRTLIVVLALTAALTADIAHAQSQALSTQRLGGDFWVQPSATESLDLSGPRYIKNLVIQANGSYGDSTVEVMVNGEIKGTIHAPGVDPSYIVTVGETARSIEFRHRAGSSMHVIAVLGTTDSFAHAPPPFGTRLVGSRDQVLSLAFDTLREIEILRTFIAPADEQTYLFPIKKHAGLLYVMATAHGDLSSKTINELLALADQITYAETFLGTLMQADQAFENVVELLTVREEIREILN